uniref:Uncharacterized protein n=1 Tax=Vannella robusta TaxID=1487602 RepID=A0A7S4MG65_9EUKA|mmetsp:Transcript_21704/g.27643  ORF Transcript_21704/g.27643 Transcript_21704/m.27643 type:complete len:339 (+) Transcript_21704:87-1103(+)
MQQPETIPQLVILEHTSLAEEKFAKNGIQKNVHVVVKNTPFHITVGFANLSSPSQLNFNIVTAEVLLMYDCEGDRFVDFIKNKPLEYKGTMNDTGDKMTLEIRMKKLSSHLEDMFFKIRVKGVDSQTKEDIPNLHVTSQPIKVVSKPEQVTRIKQKQSGVKAPKKPRTKKRSMNEMMLESMQKLEQQQAEQRQLLESLVFAQSSTGTSSGDVSADKILSSITNSKKGASVDLEQALQNLLVAYDNTDPMERPLKIRKVVGNSTASGVSSLIELSSQLLCNSQRGQTYDTSQSALNYPGDSTQTDQGNSSTSLSDDLALSEDIERIDDFYRELLLPSSF